MNHDSATGVTIGLLVVIVYCIAAGVLLGKAIERRDVQEKELQFRVFRLEHPELYVQQEYQTQEDTST